MQFPKSGHFVARGVLLAAGPCLREIDSKFVGISSWPGHTSGSLDIRLEAVGSGLDVSLAILERQSSVSPDLF